MKIKSVCFSLMLFAVSFVYAQTPEEIKAKLPKVAGWNLDPEMEVFSSRNLFQRINGAAEGFFLYNFQEMTSFVYNNVANTEYITIQVYRHDTPVDAFGVYAAERPTQTNFLRIGGQGYQEESMLNFYVDCLYVKMESPGTSDDVAKTVKTIAEQLAKNINPKATAPSMLNSLPKQNKIENTDLYIAKSFLGHEFLNKVYLADYSASGKRYQIFIIDAGSKEEAQKMLTSYYQFTKQTTDIKEGRLTIKDRYNGDLECIWKGQYIWGIFNEGGATIPVEDILKEIQPKK